MAENGLVKEWVWELKTQNGAQRFQIQINNLLNL